MANCQISCMSLGCTQQYLINGQPNYIGNISSERDLANSKLSVACLQTFCGPSGDARQYLVTGQPSTIGGISFREEQGQLDSIGSAASDLLRAIRLYSTLSGDWPT